MKRSTRDALVTLNRRFYAQVAGSFSTTRARPWQGWEKLLPNADPHAERLAVLDVGCGNGRFGSWLAERLGASGRGLDYLGIDSSAELLELAGPQLAHIPGARFAEIDLLDENAFPKLEAILSGRRFDWIALFGVLHHVPWEPWRRTLLLSLADLLSPTGILTPSIWRFDRLPRWRAKLVPWDEHNRRAAKPIDLDDLEVGDHLLKWQGSPEPPRYCHLVDDAELLRIERQLDLHCRDRFTADGPAGDTNLYLVFSRDTGLQPC